MVRSPSWCFLDIGRRLERALNLCLLARQLAADTSLGDDLGALLDLCDSQIVYRARYLSAPMRLPVIDLILLDPNNPRSLVFQLDQIEDHLAGLPTLLDDGVPERPLRKTRALLAQLHSLEAGSVNADSIQQFETSLLDLSDAVSQRYFLQYDRPDRSFQGSLLA